MSGLNGVTDQQVFELQSVAVTGVIEPPTIARLVARDTRRGRAGVVAVDRKISEERQVRIRADGGVRRSH